MVVECFLESIEGQVFSEIPDLDHFGSGEGGYFDVGEGPLFGRAVEDFVVE